MIDLEGHVTDEVVGDCLRELHMELAVLKFLGSYPVAGGSGDAVRREISELRRSADDWLAAVRAQVRGRL